MVIVGCDPDSNASGIAVYIGGNLERCECMTIMQFVEWCDKNAGSDIELHIENVAGISSSGFHVKGRDSLPVKLKKAEHVGRCKQAQIEIERIAYHYGIDVVHHKVSKAWKKDKKTFERVTGWNKRSNEDSRSAAYFGFLGCKNGR